MENGFISNYMQRAVELAKAGMGFVNPNPLVGAVIVKDTKIIGEGFHACYGQLHAERSAIADAKRRAANAGQNPQTVCRGADIYVTLEPCCHTGKQPPCTQALIDEGFARVFIGSSDPNPLVSGKGVAILEKAGIKVVQGCLKSECDALNPVFFHYIKTKTPYITLKYAMSADGLTACYTGKSRWVSGEESRLLVHKERAVNMAVMTGIETVLSDNPLLTSRLPEPETKKVRQPVRIVCDSTLRIPLESNLVQTAGSSPVWVACALSDEEIAASSKAHTLQNAGVTLLSAKSAENPRVDLRKLAQLLGEHGIDSVLLESGGRLNYSALQAGIIQKIQVFIAPKIFGSLEDVHNPVRGTGSENPDDAYRLSNPAVTAAGSDVLLEYEVKTCLPE